MKGESWVEQFSKHPGLLELRKTLTASIRKPIWWTLSSPAPKALQYADACKRCPFVRKSKSNQLICQKQFLKNIRLAHLKKESHHFLCPIQKEAAILPVLQQDRVMGYLAVCNSDHPISPEGLHLGMTLMETADREWSQAKELKRLSQTIQPRCVALSTVHTIHRLISSTLDLKELLPRVARLCCQVLRAESCTIWLLSLGGKRLEPRAVISTQKGKKVQSRSVRIGTGLVGKVAVSLVGQVKARIMTAPLVEEECIGVIQVKREKGPAFGSLDHEILTTLAEQAVVAIRNAQMYEKQERVTWGTIRSLSAILEGMDSTGSKSTKSQREILTQVTQALADEMRVSEAQAKPLLYAALLHDAGRLGVSQDILHKPSKLEPHELAKVQEHTIAGAQFLQPIEILEPAIPIMMHHHERYDGTGYPKGLKKEAIPLGARILAVANAFEAMLAERPYRRPMSVPQAVKEISYHSGTQFDPKVVQAFTRLSKSGKLEALIRSLRKRGKRNGG